ncbi:LOW QUALITY PROTEIN: synaptopodin 2-like protein [Oncorhynchus keta]|uniref:LOW QUALITY PROTEIN: synaptopodin 2-like protein n=1 Tax=Oncorhynchus keta TaxID=8018 RepID=UPI00227CF388|nr:LOW QUALITY PROTEIN: synaptopodin 2-like protein [Oncorhynchus keta]
MVAEEVVVTLSGGAPWGFRLQGGVEHQTPLQVSKVRRRSKACRAGLREEDELVAIGDRVCTELSHAQAMTLIDSHRHTLNLRIKRFRSGVHTVALSGRTPTHIATHTYTPTHSVLSPTDGPACLTITSPPDSEAYYGETDSDADTHTHTHRRQRRTPPHTRSPGRQQQEEETSELSGYESAPDGGVSLQGPWEQLPTFGNGVIQQWEQPTGLGTGEFQPGVPRREVVYQPQPPQSQPEWTHPAQHVPHPEQGEPTGGREAEGEGDSGFQEAGLCVGLACSPLVSPERARGAMMLGSSRQMVPMVGAQLTPLSDDLSTTYKDKARQAKLQRGESVVDRQVKEARTKCRSIASLLTDAPYSNSKGVLMFKKRRQRAKKFTLTCFGRAEGEVGAETGGETEGEVGAETGGETEGEEEEGSSFPSGSEVDEEGFAGTFDPTWDSGYLDLLDRRSSACPSTYNSRSQTPTNQSSGLGSSAYQSPEINVSINQGSVANAPAFQSPGLDSIAYQGKETEQSEQQRKMVTHVAYNPAPNPSPATGGPVGVSRASVVLTPPSHTPNLQPDLNPNPPGGIHNRTACPFTSGLAPSRPPVTPVIFRPVQPTPAVTMVSKPTTAVSMVTIAPPRPSGGPQARRAVSSTSLYIPPRPAAAILSPTSAHPRPPVLSPPSLASAPFSLTYTPSQPFIPPSVHTATFSPSSAPYSLPNHPPQPTQHFCSLTAHQPFSPPPPAPPQHFSAPPQQLSPLRLTPQSIHPLLWLPSPSLLLLLLINPSLLPIPHLTLTHPLAQTQPPPPLTFNPYVATATPSTAQPPSSDSLSSREQRIAVPASRTGILAEARRRSNKKPMFRPSVENKKDVSPNPALLELLQNPDAPTRMGPRPGSGPGSMGPSGGVGGVETGGESGPEEDWLRLGAEACNFMQARRGPKPPPVAPKTQGPPQVPQLAGKGGQLFARRQSRMDRYVVESTPSSPQPSPGHPRQPSPTLSLPSQFRYSSSCRAPPPISYNPLLSPSCPPQAQRQRAGVAGQGARPAGHKAAPGSQKAQGIKALDFMSRQPYQLNSSLFSYGGGTPQQAQAYQQQPSMMGGTYGPIKTPRVYEIKRFSTPPPTGPSPTIIVPRSATTLGEPLWRSDIISPLPTATPCYQSPSNTPYQPQPQWVPPPPAPNAPLPQLPSFPSAHIHNPHPYPSEPHAPQQGNRPFKSAPDLSPLVHTPPCPASTKPSRVPRPRFSTSNLGLQPSVWRPGSTSH